MLSKPAVIFPDVEQWAGDYLRAALAARPEAYAADVAVANGADENVGRVVTVADDGGSRAEVTKVSSIRFNVWADDEAEASDLARMVTALLESATSEGPICGHVSTFGPTRLPEQSERPHWFGSVDLVVRGTAL